MTTSSMKTLATLALAAAMAAGPGVGALGQTAPAPEPAKPAAPTSPVAPAEAPSSGAPATAAPAPAAQAPAPAAPTQTPPAQTPPAQTPPATTPPASSLPTPTSPSEMAPGATQSPAPAEPSKPAQTAEPESILLPDRPVLSMTGTATWEEAEKELGRSFEQIFAAIREAGLKQAGPPMVEYTESDDESFGFKAMVPLADEAGDNLPEDIERGRSPTGRALKFVHRGSFDGLEAVYNKIFDYLAAKNLQVLRVIEEYPSDPANTPADKMVTNIYVFTEQP